MTLPKIILLNSCFLLLLAACSLWPAALYADSSSTHYALTGGRFTGGGGSASSSNYQIAETSFESFSGDAVTSAGYGVDAPSGIAGVHNLAAIHSISPSDFSKHYSDESPSFTVTAADPDSDTLEYRVKQDAVVKDGPQTSNVLTWALSGSDLGRHTFHFEVIDPDGTVVKPQQGYVFRRPVK
jgi:hypothetical protein